MEIAFCLVTICVVTFNIVTSLPRPTPAAAPSKAYVCGRALAGIVGSDPTGGMDVCLLGVFMLSGRGLCNGPIPRPEESYRLWCVSECDQVKKPRHLPWVSRRGKDYETKLLYQPIKLLPERNESGLELNSWHNSTALPTLRYKYLTT
jgi:hypothetical protein